MKAEEFERVYEAFATFMPSSPRPSVANSGGSTAGTMCRPCWSNPRSAAMPRIWPRPFHGKSRSRSSREWILGGDIPPMALACPGCCLACLSAPSWRRLVGAYKSQPSAIWALSKHKHRSDGCR
jgi:hypothetical protein